MKLFDKIKNWFKKPELIPFPLYPSIGVNELENMAIILVAGSNKFTQWAMRYLHKWEYDVIFTHSFIHLENGKCLNMGLTAYTEDIKDILSKSKKYLVISYRDTTGKMVRRGKKASYEIAGDKRYKYKIYDILGFLYQGFKKIPILKNLIKPSERLNICSDLVADIYKYHMKHPLYKTVDDEEQTPNDLFTISQPYPESRISFLIVD